MKNSNDHLTVVDSQCPLGLVRSPEIKAPPPMEVITRLKNKTEALKLCVSWSGLLEGEVMDVLGIDKGQWTRIKDGKAHFPDNKEHELMDICGNEIPLIWDAARRGYELKPLQSKLEQELDQERAENAALQAKLKHFEEFMTIRKPE